jgi:hypothetical protein
MRWIRGRTLVARTNLPVLNHDSDSSPACMDEMDLRRASMKGERTERVRKKNWMVESLEKAWSAWVEEASGSSDKESGEAMEGPFRRGREAWHHSSRG